MKKSFKILFTVLSVLAALLFLGSVGMVITQVSIIIPTAWPLIFSQYLLDAAMFGNFAHVTVSPFSGILLYASLVIGIALLVLSLIFIKKKLSLKLICTFASAGIVLLGMLISSILILGPNFILFFASTDITRVIGTYAIVALAALYVLSVIALDIITIILSRKITSEPDAFLSTESEKAEEDVK
ncbi:MAG TPA: hypothetical protein PLR04_03490, partial [Bacilli bacterium]|nr:hypothetical protein [Bacilli bacterium]